MELPAMAEHQANAPTAIGSPEGGSLHWLGQSVEMRPKIQTSQRARVHGDKSNLREPQKNDEGQRSNDG